MKVWDREPLTTTTFGSPSLIPMSLDAQAVVDERQLLEPFSAYAVTRTESAHETTSALSDCHPVNAPRGPRRREPMAHCRREDDRRDASVWGSRVLEVDGNA